MHRLDDDDRSDAGGFELAMFVLALLATAIAFFLVAGSPREPVARVRFIEPVSVGGAAVDTMKTGSTGIEADPAMPDSPPTPTARPTRP